MFVNPNHKQVMTQSIWTTPTRGNLTPSRLVSDMSWDAEADENPQVEYDVEVEPEEPKKDDLVVWL